jgi:hypothetical protein
VAAVAHHFSDRLAVLGGVGDLPRRLFWTEYLLYQHVFATNTVTQGRADWWAIEAVARVYVG